MYIKGFSPSKLNTYNECELKYKYKYIHYLKEEYNETASKDALHYGSYIHKILEDGVDCTTVEELREHAKRLRDNYQFKGREADTEKCLQNFLKFNDKLTETVSTEMFFKEDVLEDLQVNGIIDRVVKGSTGKYLVIDYKTSKREKTKRELYTDPQMIIYAAAISKIYNINIDEITVAHFYPLTGNLVTISYLPTHVKNFIKRLDEKKWKIRKKKLGEFHPKINMFCDWCGYKGICPSHGASKELIEEALDKSKK